MLRLAKCSGSNDLPLLTSKVWTWLVSKLKESTNLNVSYLLAPYGLFWKECRRNSSFGSCRVVTFTSTYLIIIIKKQIKYLISKLVKKDHTDVQKEGLMLKQNFCRISFTDWKCFPSRHLYLQVVRKQLLIEDSKLNEKFLECVRYISNLTNSHHQAVVSPGWGGGSPLWPAIIKEPRRDSNA